MLKRYNGLIDKIQYLNFLGYQVISQDLINNHLSYFIKKLLTSIENSEDKISSLTSELLLQDLSSLQNYLINQINSCPVPGTELSELSELLSSIFTDISNSNQH